MTKCPCCGSEVEAELPILDLNINVVTWKAKRIRLTPRCAEILAVLVKNGLLTSRTPAILTAVWGMADEGIDPAGNLAVQMARLRRDIKPLGWKIINIFNVGYRLEQIV